MACQSAKIDNFREKNYYPDHFNIFQFFAGNLIKISYINAEVVIILF